MRRAAQLADAGATPLPRSFCTCEPFPHPSRAGRRRDGRPAPHLLPSPAAARPGPSPPRRLCALLLVTGSWAQPSVRQGSSAPCTTAEASGALDSGTSGGGSWKQPPGGGSGGGARGGADRRDARRRGAPWENPQAPGMAAAAAGG